MKISKRHMALAERILSEPRHRRRYKTAPNRISIISQQHTPTPINPYASASIVGAVDALEGGIPFGKYGSHDMHSSL